jgi:hypothetical protein
MWLGFCFTVTPTTNHWTKASMGINSSIFLKDGKPAFSHLPSSQNGWLINITAVQHVWRTVKVAGFKCLHNQNLNQDPLENTFGVIRIYCGCNSNPTVAQFVDAPKICIVNGLAFRGFCGTNCDVDDTLLDNLQLLLREPGKSLPNTSASRSTETCDVPESFHVAQQVQKDIGAAVHGSVLSSLCQWFHCHTDASWCQL